MQRVALTAVMTVLAGASVAAAQTDVVISQVYGGGNQTGASYRNDYVELFNRTGAAIDLSGYSIQYAAQSGNQWQKVDLTGSIPARSYYLIQLAGGTTNGLALPAPDVTGGINMASANGKVALVSNQVQIPNATPCPVAVVPGLVDFLAYGVAAPQVVNQCIVGSAMSGPLSITSAAVRVGDGCSVVGNNGLDFVVGAPNPRNTASPQGPVCPSVGIDLTVTATPSTLIISNAGTDVLSYALAVRNVGTIDAPNTRITLPIAAGVTNLSASQGSPSTQAGNFVVNLGTVTAGSTVNVTITCQPTAEGTLPGVFTMSTSGTDTNPGNNSASTSVVVLRPASEIPLKISQIYPGGGSDVSAVYTRDYVEIFNAGTSPVSLFGRSLQYQSATGNSWSVRYTFPDVSIPAKGYYLVVAGNTGLAGIPVPSPDGDSGVLSLSNTGGKLVIANTNAFLSGPCDPGSPLLVDFVGWGSTVFCFDGLTGPVVWEGDPLLAMFRAGGGCTDTNDNALDFTVAAPAPRNSASPLGVCGGGGPQPCSIADIVGIGGLPPGDGLLTGDDFNAFISAFAADDLLADVVGIGGLPPRDSLITGDDFNAFISAFSAGCP
jgi:uncharacterized repeat protein (TIGR01451 family)